MVSGAEDDCGYFRCQMRLHSASLVSTTSLQYSPAGWRKSIYLSVWWMQAVGAATPKAPPATTSNRLRAVCAGPIDGDLRVGEEHEDITEASCTGFVPKSHVNVGDRPVTTSHQNDTRHTRCATKTASPLFSLLGHVTRRWSVAPVDNESARSYSSANNLLFNSIQFNFENEEIGVLPARGALCSISIAVRPGWCGGAVPIIRGGLFAPWLCSLCGTDQIKQNQAAVQIYRGLIFFCVHAACRWLPRQPLMHFRTKRADANVPRRRGECEPAAPVQAEGCHANVWVRNVENQICGPALFATEAAIMDSYKLPTDTESAFRLSPMSRGHSSNFSLLCNKLTVCGTVRRKSGPFPTIHRFVN